MIVTESIMQYQQYGDTDYLRDEEVIVVRWFNGDRGPRRFGQIAAERGVAIRPAGKNALAVPTITGAHSRDRLRVCNWDEVSAMVVEANKGVTSGH